MRIGIISDVHGDLDALDNTLRKLQHEHQVSHILSAGDLVGRGPEQNRVVERHRQVGIITVRGNHDEWFSGVTKDNGNYLKDLPLDWRGSLGGKRFFMCHGKPGNNMWGMYKDHLSDTYLNMVLKSLKVDVLVTGHTHVPLYVRVGDGCILNPGSLYTFESSRVSSRTYGVLHLPTLDFELFDSRVGERIKPPSF
jgi:putative phosphoesterase